MANYQIEIDGLDEIVASLRAVGANVEDALEQIARAGADVVAEMVASGAPGDIAGAIVTETAEKKRGRVAIDVGPDTEHFYGLFLEYGTQAHEIRPSSAGALTIDGNLRAKAMHPGTTPRPFMRPAFDGSKAPAEEAMAREAKAKVKA